jgi:hypothetical protein
MVDGLFDEVVRLAEQLSPIEKRALVERLQASSPEKPNKVRPPLNLLVFEVGSWPPDLTLRREDEYGDDGR